MTNFDFLFLSTGAQTDLKRGLKYFFNVKRCYHKKKIIAMLRKYTV